MNISIVIPNYNGEKYIKNCFNALKKQVFKNSEVIFIDNGSDDRSCELVLNSIKNIKIIKLEKNYGFSKAVNEGIKVATGDYVVLLNNDTEAKEDWLQNLVNCIEQDPKIFSCCSKMIRYNEKDKIDDAGDEYTILGWAYKHGDGAIINKYCKDRQVFSSCAGAAIYRRKVFEEIGYFDEKFFAYMEDVDISYRANIYGYKNVYCSSAEIYHIGSATTGSRYNSFKVRLSARNNIYVILKNMPIVQLIINVPFLVLGFLIKYIFFWRKGLGNEYFEGIKEAVRNIHEIEKVKYSNKNFMNYVKIQATIIVNTFKLPILKLYDKL